jgi:hypothetical protein
MGPLGTLTLVAVVAVVVFLLHRTNKDMEELAAQASSSLNTQTPTQSAIQAVA